MFFHFQRGWPKSAFLTQGLPGGRPLPHESKQHTHCSRDPTWTSGLQRQLAFPEAAGVDSGLSTSLSPAPAGEWPSSWALPRGCPEPPCWQPGALLAAPQMRGPAGWGVAPRVSLVPGWTFQARWPLQQNLSSPEGCGDTALQLPWAPRTWAGRGGPPCPVPVPGRVSRPRALARAGQPGQGSATWRGGMTEKVPLEFRPTGWTPRSSIQSLSRAGEGPGLGLGDPSASPLPSRAGREQQGWGRRASSANKPVSASACGGTHIIKVQVSRAPPAPDVGGCRAGPPPRPLPRNLQTDIHV